MEMKDTNYSIDWDAEKRCFIIDGKPYLPRIVNSIDKDYFIRLMIVLAIIQINLLIIIYRVGEILEKLK
jgi:hypothetical protein